MRSVPLNCVGKIESGVDEGTYVTVVLDDCNPGAFYVLQCANESFLSSETFDSWVANERALQGFFEESGWHVLWVSNSVCFVARGAGGH
jgi:hypothetical protein